MTDVEIYDRTLFWAVSRSYFGLIRIMTNGMHDREAKALDFCRSVGEYKYREYLRIRRRRPWCRVPWQSGRRPSQQPMRYICRWNDAKFWRMRSLEHVQPHRKRKRRFRYTGKWSIWDVVKQRWTSVDAIKRSRSGGTKPRLTPSRLRPKLR